MTRWEYKIAQNIDEIHQAGALNKLGAEGWELVGFDGRGIAFFRRPIAETSIRDMAAIMTTGAVRK